MWKSPEKFLVKNIADRVFSKALTEKIPSI